ncbi:uncharacterized protein LOC120635033 [Pararge aegeria]|uniref:uncharacterized protein LOC120635033 n=1 Tax=Pararge aegeria TaxID=116150 RepID=UPI0019CFD069|nr:uncharacterized protein LOC120635033 [Pararge aegeria]
MRAPARELYVLWLFCITVFAFSLWAIASPSSFANAVKLLGNPTLKALLPEEALSLQAGVGVALLSGFFFFISYMGFYGALTGSQFLLFMYATLVILLLLLECAVMYYISSDLAEVVGTLTACRQFAIGFVHQSCRSIRSPPESIEPPWSCCAEAYPKNCTFEQVYTVGCHKAIVTWLNRYETPIYICLATFHVLLSLCSLLRRAFSASHSYT